LTSIGARWSSGPAPRADAPQFVKTTFALFADFQNSIVALLKQHDPLRWLGLSESPVRQPEWFRQIIVRSFASGELP